MQLEKVRKNIKKKKGKCYKWFLSLFFLFYFFLFDLMIFAFKGKEGKNIKNNNYIVLFRCNRKR